MILSFILFMVLFIGGIIAMGLAQGLDASIAPFVFCGGLLLVSLALAFMMRQAGSATRRSNNWSGTPTE
ncbi:MAG: hypothetical protein J7484_02785 [Microbacterium sp.]|nr:hypothetical protein [Microbacterium sp.]